jgi:hypothetical protein
MRITSAGVSEGKAEKTTPKAENPKDIRTIITIASSILLGIAPSIMPMMSENNANIKPKIVEAITSPISISLIVIGLVSSISIVLCLVSQGGIVGVTEDEVKNKVNAKREAIPSFAFKPLPA